MRLCEECRLAGVKGIRTEQCAGCYIGSLRAALASVDGHLRAIIVYSKSGSELEATACDARKVVELALGPGAQSAAASEPDPPGHPGND